MLEKILQLLLLPISLLYGIGLWIIKYLYRVRILKRASFDIPIICVGNISMGGTGKTPHIEYLLSFLQEYITVAVLSRGYRRKTSGLELADEDSTVEQIGDEPLQIKQKFPLVNVCVAADRVMAVPFIMGAFPDTKCILLDDGFQHFPIKAGLNIILTRYDKLYTSDTLLPAGTLREPATAAKRAQAIIVTKCPPNMSFEDKTTIKESLKILSHQELFFSCFRYGNPYHLYDTQKRIELDTHTDVLLFCGIADTKYIEKYLEDTVRSSKLMKYADHHYYAVSDIADMWEIFNAWQSKRKIVLTTEKDATRLEAHAEFLKSKQVPIYVLPIEVDFLFEEKEKFEMYIKNYLLNFKA
jgi:tetraacyldisaccharide 4'-kinase